MIKEIKSLTKSFKLLIYNIKNRNRLKASKEKKNIRIDICNNCPEIVKDSKLLFINKSTCGVCGCFIKYKTGIDFEECPLKKW